MYLRQLDKHVVHVSRVHVTHWLANGVASITADQRRLIRSRHRQTACTDRIFVCRENFGKFIFVLHTNDKTRVIIFREWTDRQE